MEPFQAGRYAAIDIGSHSVLLLVADVDGEGCLTPIAEAARGTRLSERSYSGGELQRVPRSRTVEAVGDFAQTARRSGALGIAVVGTAVLREAANRAEFMEQVRRECGLLVEVISGEREAELAYQGNLNDRRLPGTDGERVVIDIGGGSTEVVRGLGASIRERASYPLGAVRLTERFLKSDPPGLSELARAEALIEERLGRVDPLSAHSLVLGSGGTVVSLAAVARAAGMLPAGTRHGTSLPHSRVAELVDVFRSLPQSFRKRVPGLERDRADVILAGGMILHQLMARLSTPAVTITENGVRHGCVYAMARRVLQPR